jgi:hypothetical protein
MLAYLSSFRKSAEVGWDKKSPHARRSALTYNNEEIENSIKSSVEVLKWDQTQKNIIKTALPILALSFIALSGYENGSIGHIVREFINDIFSRHPKQTLGIIFLILCIAPLYYGVWDLYSLPPILRAKRVLASASVSGQAAFWFCGAAFLFIVAASLLALASVMAQPWAAFIRDHPRPYSWALVALSVALSIGTIYLIPFWTTRKDAAAAVRRRVRRTWRRAMRRGIA